MSKIDAVLMSEASPSYTCLIEILVYIDVYPGKICGPGATYVGGVMHISLVEDGKTTRQKESKYNTRHIDNNKHRRWN